MVAQREATQAMRETMLEDFHIAKALMIGDDPLHVDIMIRFADGMLRRAAMREALDSSLRLQFVAYALSITR